MAKKVKKISAFNIVNNLLFILLTCSFIIPFLLIIGISFSDELSIFKSGYRFIPQQFSLDAYLILFMNPMKIINAYKVSIIVSAIGTIFSLFFSASFAYVITKKDFRYANAFSLFVAFTMFFSGGLVPYYVLVTRYLHLQDTYTVLILSLFANAFYIIVLKSFFQEIPESIIESAFIDGAREIRIFMQIILPLSKAGLATVGLFTLYGYWNDWYNAMLFINDTKLAPLQYLLQMMLAMVQILMRNIDKLPASMLGKDNLPAETLRMAMVVVATGPMFIVFISLQRYFVRGITVGAVKG